MNYNIEETIKKESLLLILQIKAILKGPLTSLKAQKEGQGKNGMTTRDEDFVVQIFTANTLTPVLFFQLKDLYIKLKHIKFREERSFKR